MVIDTSAVDRFVAEHPVVRLECGCLLWRGTVTAPATSGPRYGRIWTRRNGRSIQLQAHRVAWETAYGQSLAGKVLVNVGEPVCEAGALCVNAEHWRQVSRADVPRIMAIERRTSSGVAHAFSVIPSARRAATKLSIQLARYVRASSRSTAELAAELGVSQQMVNGIRRGVYWREETPFSGLLAVRRR